MCIGFVSVYFFFSSRRRHTRSLCDWSSDVCSSDLLSLPHRAAALPFRLRLELLFLPLLRRKNHSGPGRVRHSRYGFRADRKSTRLNSSHTVISYAVFCLKKKKKKHKRSSSENCNNN